MFSKSIKESNSNKLESNPFSFTFQGLLFLNKEEANASLL